MAKTIAGTRCQICRDNPIADRRVEIQGKFFILCPLHDRRHKAGFTVDVFQADQFGVTNNYEPMDPKTTLSISNVDCHVTDETGEDGYYEKTPCIVKREKRCLEEKGAILPQTTVTLKERVELQGEMTKMVAKDPTYIQLSNMLLHAIQDYIFKYLRNNVVLVVKGSTAMKVQLQDVYKDDVFNNPKFQNVLEKFLQPADLDMGIFLLNSSKWKTEEEYNKRRDYIFENLIGVLMKLLDKIRKDKNLYTKLTKLLEEHSETKTGASGKNNRIYKLSPREPLHTKNDKQEHHDFVVRENMTTDTYETYKIEHDSATVYYSFDPFKQHDKNSTHHQTSAKAWFSTRRHTEDPNDIHVKVVLDYDGKNTVYMSSADADIFQEKENGSEITLLNPTIVLEGITYQLEDKIVKKESNKFEINFIITYRFSKRNRLVFPKARYMGIRYNVVYKKKMPFVLTWQPTVDIKTLRVIFSLLRVVIPVEIKLKSTEKKKYSKAEVSVKKNNQSPFIIFCVCVFLFFLCVGHRCCDAGILFRKEQWGTKKSRLLIQ
jgi:hypothetical protein